MSDLSAKQLKKAQGIANVDVSFRQLGNVDVKMGIKVGKHMYLIVFEGFTCHSVRKMTAKEVRETDFMIEMSPAQWDKFIAGCQSGKGRAFVAQSSPRAFSRRLTCRYSKAGTLR